MSYKILTKNAVENTNIDGARDCNFNAGRRSGIVKGAFNQGVFFSCSNNTIALDTCELRLCGHRVVIDEVEYRTLINTPSVPTRYSMVAQVVVYDNNDVSFDLFIQSSSTQLVQENLDVTGKGKFELEIGKFTQQTDGTITDIVRTADLITGGIGDLDGGAINIGKVTTNTLEPEMEAEVDVEERFDLKDKKTYTDFTFSIPKGQRGLQGIQGIQGEKGEKGDKGDKGDKGNTGATPVITATATTLSAGSSATVTKSGTAENPTFAFGIPKGDKGDTGASAGFGTPTATIDSNVGTPSVTVTASGSNTSKVFNFAFKNLKGEKGDTGNTGATGATPNISVSATTLPAGSSATATISGSAESPTINFGIPKGDKGESGEIYQSTGTSTTGAMSQKATTDELAKKAGKDNQNHFTQKNTFEQGFYINNNVSSGIYTDFYPSGSGTLSINLRKIENGTDSPLSSFSFGEGGLYFTPTGSTTGSAFITYESFLNNLKSKIYPVGSIYMSVNNTSPASFLGGTWTALDEGYTLWTTKTSGQGGAKISAGLPNITATFTNLLVSSTTGAIVSTDTGYNGAGSQSNVHWRDGSFNASKGEIHNGKYQNLIYGKSETVQPPAIKVYMWERTA